MGVIAAIAGAQIGAHALAAWPSSSMLWYLNLHLFRSFEYSFDSFAEVQMLVTDPAGLLAWVVIGLFGLMFVGVIVKIRLALALATNLSLGFSGLLLYGAYLASNPLAPPSFRLSGLWAPSCLVAVAILLVCLVSTAISHRCYWREILS